MKRRRHVLPNSSTSSDIIISPCSSRSTAFVDLCRTNYHPRSRRYGDDRQQHHHHHIIHYPNSATQLLFGVDHNIIDIDNILQYDESRPPPLPQNIIGSSPPFFLPSASLSTILNSPSYTITSITSFLLPMATQLQRIGETIFATLLLLSFVQACVALYQYRYDVRGQLVFPEGLTFGREDYYHDVTAAAAAAGSSSSTTASSAERRDANNVVDADNTDEEEKAYELLNISTEDTPSLITTTITTSSTTSWVTKLIKKLNKSLVVLLPWITRNIHSLLTRNTHLFHIGFMVFILDSLLPLLDGDDDDDKLHHAHGEKQKHHHATSSIKSISSSLGKKISNEEEPINVLVLGDSLAIGIGCVEKFDVTKDNSVPFSLIEQREQQQQQRQGPVFPQVLARTLSYHTHHPVQWRSAGVDGGSISEIKSFCMDVVKQEANAIDGSSTDIVVVLFGMNDLKKLLSVYVNPIQSLISGGSDTDRMSEGKGIKEFRRGMELFIDEIHTHAPEAVVVFPTLPIQPFHKNSIINIFPLGMMVDAVLGLWERQKRIVASKSTNALYIELTADEIADWYSPGSTSDDDDDLVVINGEDDEYRVSDDFDMDVLLSADGVHPNTNMYAQWAGLVGKKLYENIIVSLSQEEKQKTKQMV